MAKYEQYNDFKESFLAWMGDVPKHWEINKFKWVFQEKTKTLNPSLPAGSISFGNVVYKDEKNLSPDTKASYQEVLNGEYLINPLNLNFDLKSLRTALSQIDVVVSTGYIVLTDNGEFNKQYLRWLLYEFDVAHMKKLGSGVRQTINYTDIANSLFFHPEFDEQVQIANFLDHETAQIDTLIEKQQTLIQLLKEKRQAVISHAVTKGLNPDAPMKDSGVEWLGEVPEHWEVWKFQHIAPIITCGIASTPTYVDEDEGMPFLSAQNIRDNKLSLHKYNYIPYQLHEQLTKHRRPEMGDLLVTRVGAGIGDACVINIEMEFSIYVSLTHIRVNPLIGLNKFVMYFFGSDYCKYLNYQGTVTGGGVGNLNVGNVERYKIPLPDLDEQANIVHYLETESDRFDSLIKKAEQAIQLMQERRTALISAAVTGKIDVRGWRAPE